MSIHNPVKKLILPKIRQTLIIPKSGTRITAAMSAPRALPSKSELYAEDAVFDIVSIRSLVPIAN